MILSISLLIFYNMVCLSKKIGLKYVAFMQRVINYCQKSGEAFSFPSVLVSSGTDLASSAHSGRSSVVIVGVEASLGKSDVVEIVIYQLA